MRGSRFLGAATLALGITLQSAPLQAADFWLKESASTEDTLVIEGVIEKGDYEKFLSLVKRGQGSVSFIKLFTPGGDFYEAMKIGRALRKLEIGSSVPGRTGNRDAYCDELAGKPRNPTNCNAASAAFFIHIGAPQRVGTYLAVHRPYFDPRQYGTLPDAQAKVRFAALQRAAKEYMTEMEVPAHLQEVVMSTPSDKVVLLDEETVLTYFYGDVAYRQEWKKAKCGVMSVTERQQRQSLGKRMLAGQKLSDSEISALGALQEKELDEMRCSVELSKQIRLAAFKKFFAALPAGVSM